MTTLDDFSKNIIITLVSSFLTFVFTAILFWWQNWWDNRKQKQHTRQNLAKAVYWEISELMRIYKQMELSETPPQSGEDLKIAHLTQNYISVYENNLDKIGILDHSDIKDIIRLYVGIKGLIDSHIYLAKRWEIYAQYTRDPTRNPEEAKMKYEDVKSAYSAAWNYQKAMYNLYPSVLERLEKYDDTKRTKPCQT